MKNKSFVFIMIVLSALLLFACADKSPVSQESVVGSEPEDSAASEAESAEPSPSVSLSAEQSDGTDNVSENIEVDTSLLEPEFALQDFSDIADMSNYLFYYTSQNSKDASVVLTRVTHYDDRGDSLEDELKRNVQNYIDTIKGSMTLAETTEPEYFEINGYPACTFDVTGILNEGGTVYRARTLLIAGEKYVYCLQLQDSEENFPNSEPLFESVIESVKINSEKS